MQRDPLPISFADDDAAELEHLIVEYGQNMLEAYSEGNRQAAEQWLELQRAAITARAPLYVKQLEQERGLV